METIQLILHCYLDRIFMLNTHLMRLISHYLDIIKTPPHATTYERLKQLSTTTEQYNKDPNNKFEIKCYCIQIILFMCAENGIHRWIS